MKLKITMGSRSGDVFSAPEKPPQPTDEFRFVEDFPPLDEEGIIMLESSNAFTLQVGCELLALATAMLGSFLLLG